MKTIFFINDFKYFVSHRLQLAKKLSESGNIITACDLTNISQEDIITVQESGITLLDIKNNAKRGIFGKFIHCINQIAIIKSHSPTNVIFVTLESSIIGLMTSLFFRNKKYFYIVPGLGPFFLKKKIKYIFYRKCTLFLFKLFLKQNCLIVQNKDDMNFFKQKIKISNIHLIPGNGIDINYYDYHKRDNDKPSFLFLSRLVSSKGVFDYLNAAKEINKKHKEINFVLAGSFDKENPESIDFNKFNELIMNGPVNYIGEVQQKNLYDVFHQADVFVLGSEREGLPQAAIQAAATGMPLILSDVPGCRDCINNNGMTFKYGDVDGLKECMLGMISDSKKLKEYSENSRILSEERFDINIIVKMYLKLLS